MSLNRHIKALYEVSESLHQVEDMLETLTKVKKSLTHEVMQYLDAPMVSDRDKIAFFEQFNHPKETYAFLLLMLKRKDMDTFPSFYQGMVSFIESLRQEVTVDVLVAHSVTDSQKALLTESLITFLKASKVTLNIQVDKNLIGGMKLSYQGKALDYSVISSLDHMKNTI
jgi:F-type H+-transporting ATPase subunit delta